MTGLYTLIGVIVFFAFTLGIAIGLPYVGRLQETQSLPGQSATPDDTDSE